jgi:hypothetical protein
MGSGDSRIGNSWWSSGTAAFGGVGSAICLVTADVREMAAPAIKAVVCNGVSVDLEDGLSVDSCSLKGMRKGEALQSATKSASTIRDSMGYAILSHISEKAER